MSVMVYSRLGDLLRVRNLTVQDMQRQIAARFGLAVDARALDRLARADRVRRPDLEIAAAAAAVLEVGLDDLFVVVVETVAAPADGNDTVDGDLADLLPLEQSRRLQALFDQREQHPLTDDEQAELRSLVAVYGRHLHEQGLRALAEQRQAPLERVRAEVDADLDDALAWWADVQADPQRLAALVQDAQERRRAYRAG